MTDDDLSAIETACLDSIAAHRWTQRAHLRTDALAWLELRGLIEIRGDWTLLTAAGWELYEVQGIEATP